MTISRCSRRRAAPQRETPLDPFNLARFRDAQDGVFATARAELQAGRKRSHWMWFIFPQLRGLGVSPTAQFYGLASRAEAEAYRADPVLGPRLIELAEIVAAQQGRTAREIFGTPDDLKLRSCMTLFSALPGAPPAFRRVIDGFFAGEPDPRTLALLNEGGEDAAKKGHDPRRLARGGR